MYRFTVILIGNRPRGTSVLRYCKLVNRVRILGKLCRPLFISGLDDTRPMINDITVSRCFVENYRMWIIAKLRTANHFIPRSKLHPFIASCEGKIKNLRERVDSKELWMRRRNKFLPKIEGNRILMKVERCFNIH